MRTEQEMYELILRIAKDEPRIRAVLLNGSRANPNAPKDIFQDFDIVYIVTTAKPFVRNMEWIKRFGELMILQMPEDMQEPPPSGEGGFTYLMQFTDGNRIDLGIYPLEKLDEKIRDSLSVLLLDKDGIIPPLPPPNESDYLTRPPTRKSFAACCNEFWWVCPYVAKGLWREEIIYAKIMLDQIVRAELNKMLAWYIGAKTQFAQNPGKFGKYFQRYLDPEISNMLLKTYSGSGYAETWEALIMMGHLFRRVAIPTAQQFGYEYPHEDDRQVSAHLEHVRNLPKDASEIYQSEDKRS